MTQRTIRFIIALSAVALLCLIGFQGWWLWRAYTRYADDLERDVRKALTHTVERAVEDLFVSGESTIRMMALVGDSLRQSASSDSVSFSAGAAVRVNLGNEHVASRTGFGNDSLGLNLDSTAVQIYTLTSTGSTVQMDTIIRQGGSPKNGPRLQSWRGNMLSDFFMEMQHGGPGNQRSFAATDSLLSIELERAAIDIPYSFGIYHTELDSFLYTGGTEADVNALSSPNSYEALWLQGGLHGKLRLRVFFPDRVGFLLRKMGLVAGASLLLVLMVTGCLAYMLLVLIRQKRLSEIRNDFINNMTHELKTPIANISLAIESLLNFNVRNDSQRTERYLHIARDENARLGNMVEKVLQTAAFNRDGAPLKHQQVNVHTIVQKVVQSCRLQVEDRGGTIEEDLQAMPAEIIADEAHLAGVIYNLLDNASKYSPEVPQIRVRSRSEKGFLCLSVIDQGLGIASQHRNRIFEKFYRVPTGNVHNVKGFGLGLSYVREIVERHNGSVEVRSEPGKGSEFNIRLPYG